MSTNSESVYSELIDLAAKKAGSQAALARDLGWQLRALTRVRNGEKISPFRAARLAEYLSLDPSQAVWLALADASRTEEEAGYWAKKFGGQISAAREAFAEAIVDAELHAHFDFKATSSSDAALLDAVRDGFGLNSDEEVAALISIHLSEVADIRAGRRRLTIFERLKILDRTAAIRTRKLIESVLPRSLGDALEKWVHKTMRADAKSRLQQRARKS